MSQPLETAYYRGQCDTLETFANRIAPTNAEFGLLKAWIADVRILTDAIDQERKQHAVSVADQVLMLSDLMPPQEEPLPAPVNTIVHLTPSPVEEPLSVPKESTNYDSTDKLCPTCDSRLFVRLHHSDKMPFCLNGCKQDGEEQPLSVPILDPQPRDTEASPESPALCSQETPITIEGKPCSVCGKIFGRPPGFSNHRWNERKTCSPECMAKAVSKARSASKPTTTQPTAKQQAHAHARDYIHECIKSRQPIDQGKVSEMTGLLYGDLRKFVQKCQDELGKPTPTVNDNIQAGIDALVKAIHGADDEDDEE